MFKNKKILIGVTGSIAAYKAADLVSKLVQMNNEVQVVMTKNALNFIGATTFEGLTGKPVLSDDFTSQNKMAHIDLAKWFDVFLIYPATAQTINSLACGIGSELLNTIFLTCDFKKPVFIAPAMNTKMYHHPTVFNSLTQLKNFGCHLLPTDIGLLACGDLGEGKLLNPEITLNSINDFFKNEVINNKKKVLVTYGGTIEDIDGVRQITNFSSGKTGQFICEELAKHKNLELTVLKSERSPKPKNCHHVIDFTSFDSLQSLIKFELEQSFDFVIHLAAVSDYSIDKIVVDGKPWAAPLTHKIDSSAKLNIELKPNFKIISKIKDWSVNKNIVLIGFKLTNTDDQSLVSSGVKKLFVSGADIVVHNQLQKITSINHEFTVFEKGKMALKGNSKIELSNYLLNLILANKENLQEVSL